MPRERSEPATVMNKAGEPTGPRPAARRMQLLVFAGPGAGRTFALADGALLGRGQHVACRLEGADVSREHARIERRDGAYWIVDLGSSNGTWVNGEPVAVRILVLGDRITLGSEIGLVVTQCDEAEEVFRQSQRLEAVGRLAGGIAHDFNNLIAAILTNVQFVRGLEPGTPVDGTLVDEALRDVEATARLAAEFTERLLRFSQRGRHDPEPVDLAEIATGALRMVRRTFDHAIAVRVDVAPDAAIVADRAQLQQVVVNLCLNARDAMPGGGELRLAVLAGSEARIDEDDAAPDPGEAVGYWVLEVSDSGVGMDSETLDRLFEPFFTTKPRGQGSGLGLSTAYGIVRMHGGRWTVRSRPGAGSRFRVWIPGAGPG